MEKYDSYKFSGIDWIGEIPTHWETVKLKYLTESRKELSEDGREELLSVTESRGIVKRREFKGNDENLSRSENLTGYRLVKQGNLVNNIMLMWKRGLGVSPYDGIVSPAYSVFSFMNNCHPAYFHYLLRSEEYITEFRRNSTGVVLSRLRLYDDSFGSVFSHYPPVNEQQLISRYLDKKTEQIDSLIEKIQKKIELLKEQRTSLINQCVTKGLDPNVEMRDSGVEWIGEIPKHWEIKRLGMIGRFSKGKNITKGDLTETGCPVILYSHLYTTYERETSDVIYFVSEEKSEESTKINPNTFLFTSSGESKEDIGKTLVYKGDKPVSIGGDMVVFTLKEPIKYDLTFLSFGFNSKSCQNQKSSSSRGEIVVHIYEKQLREVWMCVPPTMEQELIGQKLTLHNESSTQVIDCYQQKILLLKEYRQSLISSVVTGKVRVTEDMI